MGKQKIKRNLQCLILSEKELSGMAFFKKFNMDFKSAALCGKHCTPEIKESFLWTFKAEGFLKIFT